MLVKCDLQTVHTSSLGKREKVENNQPRAEGQQKKLLEEFAQRFGLPVVDFNEVLTGLPGVQLDLHWSYTPPAPARIHILREPGLEKALEIHCWDRIESYPSVFQKCKMLSGFKSTLRRLRGAQVCQDVAQDGWCTSHEVRHNLAKGFNLKNKGVTAVPMIRYYILIVEITMFLSK